MVGPAKSLISVMSYNSTKSAPPAYNNEASPSQSDMFANTSDSKKSFLLHQMTNQYEKHKLAVAKGAAKRFAKPKLSKVFNNLIGNNSKLSKTNTQP